MTDAEYVAWMTGTLQGVSGPVDSINNATFWAWSSAEGGRIHMNPLNTTEWEPGAVAWNTLPSGGHVWTYPDVATAVEATVATLLNGDYPTILAHLRASVPRQEWSDACAELDLWGTGCGWLETDYGSPPVFGPVTGGQEVLDPNDPIVQQIQTQLATCFEVLSQLGSYPVGKAALDADAKVTDLEGKVDALTATLARIEAALKAA